MTVDSHSDFCACRNDILEQDTVYNTFGEALGLILTGLHDNGRSSGLNRCIVKEEELHFCVMMEIPNTFDDDSSAERTFGRAISFVYEVTMMVLLGTFSNKYAAAAE